MWHFDLCGFVRYMCSEFPVCNNPFTRGLLENVTSDAVLRNNTPENLTIALTDVIPEITKSEIKRFIIAD